MIYQRVMMDVASSTEISELETDSHADPRIKCIPIPCEDQRIDTVYYFKQGYSFGEHGEIQITEDNFYENYDPILGLNIAATLGTCIFLFVLFLIYKHHMKTKNIRRERERRRAARARARSKSRSLDISAEYHLDRLKTRSSCSRSTRSVNGSSVQYQNLAQEPCNAQSYASDTGSLQSSGDSDSPKEQHTKDFACVDIERTPTQNSYQKDESEAGTSGDCHAANKWLRIGAVSNLPSSSHQRALSLPEASVAHTSTCYGKTPNQRTQVYNSWPKADSHTYETCIKPNSSTVLEMERDSVEIADSVFDEEAVESLRKPVTARQQIRAQYLNDLCSDISDLQIQETKL